MATAIDEDEPSIFFFCMNLQILVGTMSGNAESVAQAIQMDCADLVESIDVALMDTVDLSIFDEDRAQHTLYLICTSTYGSGDVPDNAQALLSAFSADPRYLGHVYYGVIALGDESYGDTFAGGGRKFDAALQDVGAHRVLDLFIHDACSNVIAEEAGVAWCREWLPAALAAHPVNQAAMAANAP